MGESGATDRHPDWLKRSGRRLRKAQENLKAAEQEFLAAKEEFLPLYGRYLREDPEMRRKAEEAEQRIAEGPPWDDLIKPSDLRTKGSSTHL